MRRKLPTLARPPKPARKRFSPGLAKSATGDTGIRTASGGIGRATMAGCAGTAAAGLPGLLAAADWGRKARPADFLAACNRAAPTAPLGKKRSCLTNAEGRKRRDLINGLA